MGFIQNRIRPHMLFISIFTLTGCGSINSIGFHEPYLEDKSITTVNARDGIAFSAGDICIHVSEGSTKSIQPRAMTLVGVPIVPVDFSISDNQATFTDISIWLIPKYGDTKFTVDVSRIELEYNDGSRRSPSIIQVSQFKTTFKKENVYFFTPEIVETISYPYHWDAQPVGYFDERLELWDWTRLNIRYTKPGITLQPKKLHISGIYHDKVQTEMPDIGFHYISEIRQAFPGRFADGTSASDWPDRACRSLQKK